MTDNHDGLRAALMVDPACPPPSAWAAAVALVTAEITATDDPQVPPVLVGSIVGHNPTGVELGQIARCCAWIAAELVDSLNRDRAAELLQRLGAAAAGG